jgi:hypothetical protein
MLAGMSEAPAVQRVEVRFVVSAPPGDRLERASGVSNVEIDGLVLRCQVHGSFQPFLEQPFLEALRGYEVVSLNSIPQRRSIDGGDS